MSLDFPFCGDKTLADKCLQTLGNLDARMTGIEKSLDDNSKLVKELSDYVMSVKLEHAEERGRKSGIHGLGRILGTFVTAIASVFATVAALKSAGMLGH